MELYEEIIRPAGELLIAASEQEGTLYLIDPKTGGVLEE